MIKERSFARFRIRLIKEPVVHPEFRRTGYPKLFRPKQNLAPSIIDTQLGPRRLLYNETELSSNTVEVNNAIQLLKAESSEVKGDGDTGGTRLWWDRKDKGNF